MKRPALAALVFLCLGIQSRGEILDKIVAVINGRFIVTMSDLQKERMIRSALGTPTGTDEAILQDIVDRHLINEQIAQFAGIEVSQQAIDERLAQVRNRGGLTLEELRNAVIAEISFSEFVIQRFRQHIRVSEEEIRNYYQDVFVPAARAKTLQVPPIDAVTADIQREIVGQKLDSELKDWLETLRRRNNVETVFK